MDTEVAKSDSKNCFNEDMPLPDLRLLGVCSLMFIFFSLRFVIPFYSNGGA